MELENRKGRSCQDVGYLCRSILGRRRRDSRWFEHLLDIFSNLEKLTVEAFGLRFFFVESR